MFGEKKASDADVCDDILLSIDLVNWYEEIYTKLYYTFQLSLDVYTKSLFHPELNQWQKEGDEYCYKRVQ